jgi:hypothetical protein
MPTMKFTGFDTAAHTARTASRSGRPGAKRTSAPARSNARRRAIVAARLGVAYRRLCARGQSEPKWECPCGLGGCSNSFHGENIIVERVFGIARRILDRAAN